MQAVITRDTLLSLSDQRTRVKRALLLAEEWEKKLSTKLDGPAKNFLPGYPTVDEVRERINQLHRLTFDLQFELDRIERDIE